MSQQLSVTCKKIIALSWIILSMTTLAFAASPPQQNTGAGDVLNQIERSQQQVTPLKQPPQLEEKKEIIKTKSQGTLFQVKRFTFEGNSLFTSEELQKRIANYLNRDISIDELKVAADDVALFYQEKGYLVQTSLPKQDITEGVVKIIILEAKYGGIKLNLSPDQNYHVNPSIVEKIIETYNPKNQPLNNKSLDRAILIADDLPGIKVNQSLEAGEVTGETTSKIQLKNESWVAGNASIDNFGSRATGHMRYLGIASILSPLKLGDKVDVTYLHSLGSDYGRLSYNIPIGNYGLRAGINGSLLKYDVIANDIGKTKPKGTAKTFQIEASYPLYRTRSANLKIGTNFEKKYFRNEALDIDLEYALTNEYQINLFNVGLIGDTVNNWMMGGQTNVFLDFDIGRANFNDSPEAYKISTSFNKISSNFNRMRINAIQTQFIKDDLSMIIKFNGQLSDKNLDPSQKIYLGGAFGVRAYPTSEGSGSEGFIFNAEIRKELPRNFTLSGFYDFGYAKQYVDNTTTLGTSITSGNTKNEFNLKGYGVSLSWAGPFRSNLTGLWARRIGSNPNPQASGTDSDGSHPGNFYWLQASINF
ncbi:ShlB/FhaC/HecB family hemolysin secretion/activation protein [Candidatus Methylopumilus rimovensis]|uniref:ShlB/FhaC/HecB family hemolysin secretion/activation protein n=1 Tax=Candidatus Methylopumilus rimovensis TaxID=2588535 RepID=UPI0016719897|nr:ShlB/FhaC/HecB family hemolysin secretion/activation protein [Candidatus Methylopumilus rimovensis]